jgi:hypothetical protein
MIGLKNINEPVALTVLGAIISGYALYALFEPKPPELNHPAWAAVFGLLAGLLGGAYNTSGPPVVVYGNARRWSPAEFKSHLQGFFLLNSVLVVAGHLISGNYTAPVWQHYLIALPGLALGIFLGVSLDRRINPQIFRKLVLVMLLVVGLKMLLWR